MAFDGITVAALTAELNQKLSGGRIYKIAQPEPDELLLTIKNNNSQYKLLLSADASLPLVFLTENKKPSPMTAPAFCMLLRKHLQNARIVGITQPGMERILHMELEHLDEMGDLKQKDLIIEIMGKHSNIILVDDQNRIVDSIKHISGMVSSVREVLPGRDYFVPEIQNKKNPLLVVEEEFLILPDQKAAGGKMEQTEKEAADKKDRENRQKDEAVQEEGRENRRKIKGSQPIYKTLYCEYTGISPAAAMGICEKAGIDTQQDTASLTVSDRKALWQEFSKLMYQIKKGVFSPCIYYENGVPAEFSAVDMLPYSEKKEYESISRLLQDYYAEKNKITRLRQRSGDLRRLIQTATERAAKKYDLQTKQLEDTGQREKYRIYGELLNTYGYSAEPGTKELEALNYYSNEMIRIPLDPTITATENAKKYFEKYNKQKRTFEALTSLIQETREELEHLESIKMSLELARSEEDLLQIKAEMIECGYMKRKGGEKISGAGTKAAVKNGGKPMHFISSDGFHIYVGKNNYQNEALTFQLANGGDWWFHAKHAPGSHVIVKTEGKELPDRVYEEAASLAAYYSKISNQDKVEVDYTQRKNVKKPASGNPGMVIYHTNYSMIAIPGISRLIRIDEADE